MNNELQVIINESRIAEQNAKQILGCFGVSYEEAKKLLDGFSFDAETGEMTISKSVLVVTDEEDFDGMAEAKDKKKALRDIRLSVEKNRKDMKEDYLRTGQAIDSVAKYIRNRVEPAEKYYESQEKFAEVKALERAAAKKAGRLEKLAQVGADPAMYNYEGMLDSQFDELIAKLETDKKVAEEAAAKAEADRLAAIEAEKKRQAEIEAENARLKKEAEEREKAAAEERAKLQAEADKKLAAERAAADEERRKREAIEAEQRAQTEAEARKKAEAEEAKRQALLAPDKEKIVSYANALNVLRSQAPTVKSQAAQELLNSVDTAIAGFVEKILVKAKSL